MNKIDVVSALYKVNAKEIVVLSCNEYEFMYKNFKIRVLISQSEYIFTVKKIGKKETSQIFPIKNDKDIKHIMKSAFALFDSLLKRKTR